VIINNLIGIVGILVYRLFKGGTFPSIKREKHKEKKLIGR